MTGMACGLYEGLSPLPKDPVPGMAYVPYQQWDAQLHSIDRALDAGTHVTADVKRALTGSTEGAAGTDEFTDAVIAAL